MPSPGSPTASSGSWWCCPGRSTSTSGWPATVRGDGGRAAGGLGATAAAAGREAVQVAALQVLGDPQSSVCRGCAAHVASGLAVAHQRGGRDAEAWGGQPCSALRGLGVGPEQAWGSGLIECHTMAACTRGRILQGTGSSLKRGGLEWPSVDSGLMVTSSRPPGICCWFGGGWWLLPRLVLSTGRWSVTRAGHPRTEHCPGQWPRQVVELTPALLSSRSHHVLPPRQPAIQHYLGVLHGGGVPDHGRVQHVSAAWPWGLGGLWGHDPAATPPPLRPAHSPCEVSRRHRAFFSRALLSPRGPGPGRETGREPSQGRDTDHGGPVGVWVPGAGLRLTGRIPRDRTCPVGLPRRQAPRSCRRSLLQPAVLQ